MQPDILYNYASLMQLVANVDVVLKVVVEYRAVVGDARARRTVVAGGHAAATSYQSAVSKNSRRQRKNLCFCVQL